MLRGEQVGMGSIGVVGLVVVIAMSAPRRAGTAKAKADVFSDVKGAGGASKIQHLLPLVEATMQEAPVRALHKDVCEFFSVLAQSSLEYVPHEHCCLLEFKLTCTSCYSTRLTGTDDGRAWRRRTL